MCTIVNACERVWLRDCPCQTFCALCECQCQFWSVRINAGECVKGELKKCVLVRVCRWMGILEERVCLEDGSLYVRCIWLCDRVNG